MTTCEICGAEGSEAVIETMHRACRLGAAFPDAASTGAGGLVSFDMAKIKEAIGWTEPFRSHGGVEFKLEGSGYLSIAAPIQVGNSLGSWCWMLTPGEVTELRTLLAGPDCGEESGG